MKTAKPLAEWVATGLGAGYLPIAPGTWGSLQAVVLAWLVHIAAPGNERLVILGLCIAVSIVGVAAAGATAKRAGDSDPSKVVIDEIAGQLLALTFIPFSFAGAALAFLLFRLFDIVKPFPAGRSESLPGGWGIMADDWIAGLYAGVVLLLVHSQL